MAKARMLHKKISISTQVNKLSLGARLLFSWLIPHADDDGRLKGDPEYVKATVVPMTRWSFNKVKSYLDEIESLRLINYWDQDSELFIEFPTWLDHQQIRSDRYKPSKLPSMNEKNDNRMATASQPIDHQMATQSNVIKSNLIKSSVIDKGNKNESPINVKK